MRLALPALALSASLAFAAPRAGAQQPPSPPAQTQSVKTEVMFVLATNDGSGVDPKLASLKELKSPPFSTSFNSFKQLGDATIDLPLNHATNTTMPTKDILVATYTGTAPNDAKSAATKFVISASITKPTGATVLPSLTVNAQSGRWFFITGQSYNGGTLIIAMKVV